MTFTSRVTRSNFVLCIPLKIFSRNQKPYKSKFNNKYTSKQGENIHLKLDCFNRQYKCPVWWTSISTYDQYSNGY